MRDDILFALTHVGDETMIAWSLFIPACFLLNAAPGPNNMLAFSNGARLGLWPALIGGMGRMPAFAFLILLTVVGLGALLAASADALFHIRIVGAAYLLYVGVRIFLGARKLATMQADDANIFVLMRRDFTIAIANPKAIAIFTAFFPQFMTGAEPAWLQLLKMGGAFMVMEVVAVFLYVAAGATLGKFIRSNQVFINLNRLVGCGLVFAAGSMAFSRS